MASHALPLLLRLLQYVWALPNTLIGLLLVVLALLTRGGAQVIDGVVEGYGGLVGWALRRHPLIRGGVAAMTLGHVVVGIDRDRLARTRIHERVHVAQYGRWGPFFLPAYGASSLLCVVRKKDPYMDNVFEMEAYAVERERKARLT